MISTSSLNIYSPPETSIKRPFYPLDEVDADILLILTDINRAKLDHGRPMEYLIRG